MNSTLDEPLVIMDEEGQTIATANGTEPQCFTGDVTHSPIIAYPVALRGREDGAELEWSEPGDPAYSLRTGSGGSSKPMVCITGKADDGAEAEARSREILSILQSALSEETAAEWRPRIHAALHSPEVLRSKVHGEGVRCEVESINGLVDNSLSCEEADSTGAVLEVRETGCVGCSSHGRGSHEQRSDEFDEVVSLLSHPRTSGETMHALRREAQGSRVLREALTALEEMGRSDAGSPQRSPDTGDRLGGGGVEGGVRRLTPL